MTGACWVFGPPCARSAKLKTPPLQKVLPWGSASLAKSPVSSRQLSCAPTSRSWGTACAQQAWPPGPPVWLRQACCWEGVSVMGLGPPLEGCSRNACLLAVTPTLFISVPGKCRAQRFQQCGPLLQVSVPETQASFQRPMLPASRAGSLGSVLGTARSRGERQRKPLAHLVHRRWVRCFLRESVLFFRSQSGLTSERGIRV